MIGSRARLIWSAHIISCKFCRAMPGLLGIIHHVKFKKKEGASQPSLPPAVLCAADSFDVLHVLHVHTNVHICRARTKVSRTSVLHSASALARLRERVFRTVGLCMQGFAEEVCA